MKESAYLKAARAHMGRLRRMPAFSAFKDEHLALLLSMSKVQWFEPGETIIREGEYSSWMYFIISGEVRVAKRGEEITHLRGCGEVFGEMSVIDGSQRSATILAQSAAMLLAVDASFLDRLQGGERTLCYTLLNRLFASILAERLRTANCELSDTLRHIDQARLQLASRAAAAGRDQAAGESPKEDAP